MRNIHIHPPYALRWCFHLQLHIFAFFDLGRSKVLSFSECLIYIYLASVNVQINQRLSMYKTYMVWGVLMNSYLKINVLRASFFAISEMKL